MSETKTGGSPCAKAVLVSPDFLSTQTENNTISKLGFYLELFPEDGRVIIKSNGKEGSAAGSCVWDIHDDLPVRMEKLDVGRLFTGGI